MSALFLIVIALVVQLWSAVALYARTTSSGVVQLDRVSILCVETHAGSSSRVTVRAESSASGAAPVLLVRSNAQPSSTRFDSRYTIPLERSALELSLTLDGPTPIYLGIWGGRVENSLRYFAGDPDVVYYSISYETIEEDKASLSKNVTEEELCMTLQRDAYKVPPGNPFALSSSLAGATRVSSTLLACQLSVTPLFLSVPQEAPGVLSMQSADAFLRNHWRARGDNDTVIDYSFRGEDGSGPTPPATAAFLSGALPSSVGQAMGGGVVQVQVWVRLARAVPGESTAALRERLRRAMGGGLLVSLRAGGLALRPHSSSSSSPPLFPSSTTAAIAAATLVLHSAAAAVVEIRDASRAGSRAGQGRLDAWVDGGEDEEDEDEEAGGASSALGALQALLGLAQPSPSPAPAPAPAASFVSAAAGRRKARSSKNSNRGEEEGASGNEGLLLVWSVQSPPLHGPALSALGITVVRAEASDPSAGASGLDSGLIVSVGLVSQPCGASSCGQRQGQGRCEVESSPSPRGVCVCRLPWGGEDCSQLVQDQRVYYEQLGLLVGSNVAIAPGVWVAAGQGRWAFAAVMLTSALSSAFYHLCDMEAYCLPLGGDSGRTYSALQAFDITFSTLTVAAMILLHGHLGSLRATEGEVHAALTVVMLGLLLPAVGADPTRVQNIALAVAAAVVLCVLSWMQALAIAVREGRCCWCAKQRPESKMSRVVASSSSSSSSEEEAAADAEGDEGGEGGDDASEGEDGQGVEMSTIALSGDWNPAQVRASHHPASSSSSSSKSLSASRARAAAAATTTAAVKAAGLALSAARPLAWSLLGASLAAAGIAAFALQTIAAKRGGYFWAHSSWHFLVMLSGWPLLKGKDKFVAWLSLRLGIREK